MAGDRVDVAALESIIRGKDASPEQKAEARRLLAANDRLEEAAAELRAAGVEVDESDFEACDELPGVARGGRPWHDEAP